MANQWMHHEDETIEAERRAEYEESRKHCVICGYEEGWRIHQNTRVSGRYYPRHHQFIGLPPVEEDDE